MRTYRSLCVLVALLSNCGLVATKTSFCRFTTSTYVLWPVRTGPVLLSTVSFIDDVLRLACDDTFNRYRLTSLGNLHLLYNPLFLVATAERTETVSLQGSYSSHIHWNSNHLTWPALQR